jgi:hypothetical protein
MGPELFELAQQHGLATPSRQPYAPRPGSLAAEYVLALAALRRAEMMRRRWRSLALAGWLAGVVGMMVAIGERLS